LVFHGSSAVSIGPSFPAEGLMIDKAFDVAIAELKCLPGELEITWQNSSYSVYSSLWLRDNDPVHRDPLTGQRRVSLLDLPQAPQLLAAEAQPAGHLTLRWDDGKTSILLLSWLRAFDRSLRISPRPIRLPWMGQPTAAFAWCDYTEWISNPASREDWLYYVGRDGLAFLRGVPTEEGAGKAALLRISASISLVSENNGNRLFDIRGGPETSNNGYIIHPPPIRTGQPYRDPVPGFQMLHCLSAAGPGAETAFVDGMAVAERLRARDVEAFNTLSQIPILYRFADGTVELATERTMIEVDTQGQFRAICYDDCSIAPLPLKGPRLKKYYAAYRQLAELLHEPARTVTWRLQPGELVLFDNSRILHGHSIGSCHLQGCPIDSDGLYSALAVLSRKQRDGNTLRA
jgi:TfdA family taurine catabolism dioxygenase TauD